MHDGKRVLVVGNRGSIGRRYQAILNHFEIDNDGYDSAHDLEHPNGDFSHIIIATPSGMHYEHIIKYAKDYPKAEILCEKPISRKLSEIQDLIDRGLHVRMVCNYLFCDGMRDAGLNNHLYYNHYNTGRDGFAWDLIQLIYLAKGRPQLLDKSPFFSMSVNGVTITLDEVMRSYLKMIQIWLKKPEKLWSLKDALKATEKTILYETDGM